MVNVMCKGGVVAGVTWQLNGRGSPSPLPTYFSIRLCSPVGSPLGGTTASHNATTYPKFDS